MKRLIACLLACLLLAACSRSAPAPVSSAAPAPITSAAPAPVTSAVSESVPESSAPAPEPVPTESDAERTARMSELLDGWMGWHDVATADNTLVCSDGVWTLNAENLAQFAVAYQNNESATCTVLFLGTIPEVYLLESQPDQPLDVRIYQKQREAPPLETRIQPDGIYESFASWMLRDGQNMPTVPKIDLSERQPIAGYVAGEPLAADAISPADASAIALRTAARLSAFIAESHAQDINPMHSSGVLIPADFMPDPTVTPRETRIENAVQIAGTPYYQVDIYEDSSQSETYYISADGSRALLISMVDGRMIPVFDAQTVHYIR